MSVVRVYFVYYNTIIQSVAPTQIKINNNKIRKMYENTKKKLSKYSIIQIMMIKYSETHFSRRDNIYI